MENLSSSCVALVTLWSADKRLSSAVALVRVGRALLSSFLFPDTLWSSLVIALSVVVSCATDLVTSHAWLK